jgi:hypothetical protein
MNESISIRGGLTADASSEFATVGDRRIDRGACEDPEAFKQRVMLTAQACGEVAVFGGLPPRVRADEGAPASSPLPDARQGMALHGESDANAGR